MPRNLLFCTLGSEIFFAAKRKMAETIFMAQPSLFLPYFDLTMQYHMLLVIRSLHRDIELYKFTLVMQKRILTFFHHLPLYKKATFFCKIKPFITVP